MPKETFELNPLTLLKELAAQPSVSTDPQPEYLEGLAATRAILTRTLEAMRFAVNEIPTARHAVLQAEYGTSSPNNTPHILLYGHYDVQPPGSEAEWTSAAFEPTERAGRIYARGVADNKGPTCAMLAGIHAFLAPYHKKNETAPVRITWVLEGEEEIGSENLAPYLEANKAALAQANCVILSDTGALHGKSLITTGIRGMQTMEVTVHGPASEIHSGLYGGAVVNPVRVLSHLLSTLHTPEGTVNVPGFYNGVQPASEWERGQISDMGGEDAIARLAGVPQLNTETAYSALECISLRPTLEFHGIHGGYTGVGNKSVIPPSATVKIGMRLVSGQNPADVAQAVKRALEARLAAHPGSKGARLEVAIEHGLAAYSIVPPHIENETQGKNENEAQNKRTLTPETTKAFEAAASAAQAAMGGKVIYARCGGFIGAVAAFHQILGLDSIMLGLSLPEDGMHEPNESFDIAQLQRGADMYTQLFKNLIA